MKKLFFVSITLLHTIMHASRTSEYFPPMLDYSSVASKNLQLTLSLDGILALFKLEYSEAQARINKNADQFIKQKTMDTLDTLHDNLKERTTLYKKIRARELRLAVTAPIRALDQLEKDDQFIQKLLKDMSDTKWNLQQILKTINNKKYYEST